MRRQIWCEMLPLAELGSDEVVTLLARFHVAPIVAVWPETIAQAEPVLAKLAAAGLAPSVWPMLADRDGRWLGAENAGRFAAFVEEAANALAPREIVLDLEPPIAAMRATVADRALHAHMLPPGVDAASFQRAKAALVSLERGLHARGIAVSAAVAPPTLIDGAWEERLGTPVSGVAWDHVSAMLYTSILEGWSRGLLGRADVRGVLAAFCEAAALRFGARAGASLGAVGVGAFGDEPTYRSPAELADDVALARAAGIDDLALFDLGGVLRRPPADAWLDAFVSTPAAPRLPSPTARARAAIAGTRLAGSAFAAIARARDLFSGARHR